MALEVEQRARNFLFTISIAGEGGEHKLMGCSGVRRIIDEISHTESHRIDTISLAGHFNVENITLREAPFEGCISEAAPNFLFQVDVDGTIVARCRRISGLSVNWEVIENRESDQLATQKLWGKRSYGEVTHDVVIDWQEKWQLYNFAKKLGEFSGPGPQFATVSGSQCNYVADVGITVKKQDGENVAKWILHRAWPSSWQPTSDLAADANEVSLESVTWRIASLPGMQGVEEVFGKKFAAEQLVSSAFYDWVAAAYNIPYKKDLILSIYHPGQIPGKDAPAARLKLFNAWVSAISWQDLDANANEVLQREITVTYEGVRPL